jgi:hypothetical protein
MQTGFASDTELTLAGIWTGLLGVDNVGRGDDFFDRGGDSMLAVRMVLAARNAWNVDLGVRVLHESPVLKDLAGRIDALVDRPGNEQDARR